MYKRICSLVTAILIICILSAGCNFMEQPGQTIQEDVPDNMTLSPDTQPDVVTVDPIILNYFYIDAITSQYGKWETLYGKNINESVKSTLGLDTSVSLGIQYYNVEQKITWADYFLAVAKDNAHTAYAMYQQAKNTGYTLSADASQKIDSWIQAYETRAERTGVTTDQIAIDNYGKDATFDSWKMYLDIIITAQDYTVNYANSLTYTADDLSDYAFGRESEFNSYSLAYYYIGYNQYPHLGTTDEEGVTFYSDEQKTAALKEAKKDAESLLSASNPDAFDQKISQLDCNKNETNISSIKKTRVSYHSLNTLMRSWLCDSARKPGDMTVIADLVSGTDENGNTVTSAAGYYVVYFMDVSDNVIPLSDVRHLFVACQGGTAYPDGEIVYSADELDAAKTKAETLLRNWKENPTQENFISMVREHTDDTASADNGGLYENISPFDNYVPSFLAWSTDDSRQPGDTDVIAGEGGYHIMYYVGRSARNYRETLIAQALRNADYDKWCSETTQQMSIVFEATSLLDKNLILTALFE